MNRASSVQIIPPLRCSHLPNSSNAILATCENCMGSDKCPYNCVNSLTLVAVEHLDNLQAHMRSDLGKVGVVK